MRIFRDELIKRHHANLRALYRRHKASVGYAILAVGIILALFLSAQALSRANERAERQAAIICQTTITADKQALTNLVTQSGHELIKDFHLTLPQAALLIHKNLEASANERKALQPSKPASACTDKLTTLKINPPRVTKASEKALKLAETATTPQNAGSKPSTSRKTVTPTITSNPLSPKPNTQRTTKPPVSRPSPTSSTPAPSRNPGGNLPKGSGGTTPPVTTSPEITKPPTETTIKVEVPPITVKTPEVKTPGITVTVPKVEVP